MTKRRHIDHTYQTGQGQYWGSSFCFLSVRMVVCSNVFLHPSLARATSLPSAPKNVSPKKMADPDPECEFCQSIVKLVHDELKDEKTEVCAFTLCVRIRV